MSEVHTVSLVSWRISVLDLLTQIHGAATLPGSPVPAVSVPAAVDYPTVECVHARDGILWRAVDRGDDWWRLHVWCLNPARGAHDEQTNALALHAAVSVEPPWRTYDFLPGRILASSEPDAQAAYYDFWEAASVAATDADVACLNAVPGVQVLAVSRLGALLLEINGRWDDHPFTIGMHDRTVTLAVAGDTPCVVAVDDDTPPKSVHRVAALAVGLFDQVREQATGTEGLVGRMR